MNVKVQLPKFVENILKRKTVRNFKNKPLELGMLELLVAAAQSAPTSSMIQPWSIIALTTNSQKAKLFSGDNYLHMGLLPTPALDGNPPDIGNFRAIMQCSVFLIWLVDCTIMDKIFTDPSLDETHPELVNLRKTAYNASQHANVEIRSITDAVIAAQTLVITAESLGLGTMYCGSIRTMDLRETFNIPNRATPLFGICIGYPDDNLNVFGVKDLNSDNPIYVKPRLPQEIILHKESYHSLDFEEVKKYNKLLQLFYKVENLKLDWFDRVVRRTQLYKTNINYKTLLEKCGFKFK
jgi:nitroreductase